MIDQTIKDKILALVVGESFVVKGFQLKSCVLNVHGVTIYKGNDALWYLFPFVPNPNFIAMRLTPENMVGLLNGEQTTFKYIKEYYLDSLDESFPPV